MMEYNLAKAQRFLFPYRWSERCSLATPRFKQDQLEPRFSEMSSTYRLLSKEERKQFFDDLNEQPNPRQYDWAHFLLNLVLFLP